MITWHLGTMGFGYQDWKGGFYPPDATTDDFLPYYSQCFNAVELDTTFYGVPRQSTVVQWSSSVPEDFKFCAKLPRIITHDMRLINTGGIVQEFVEAMKILDDKLGILLVQLPPSFDFQNFEILQSFLSNLPVGVHFAVEFRHASWYQQNIVDLLRKFQVGWVATEFPGLPMQIVPTTDFIYIRWIGQHGSYPHHRFERVDRTPQLIWWREHIVDFSNAIPTVYGFFNNDYAGFAAGTCNKFKGILGMPINIPRQPQQPRLF